MSALIDPTMSDRHVGSEEALEDCNMANGIMAWRIIKALYRGDRLAECEVEFIAKAASRRVNISINKI